MRTLYITIMVLFACAIATSCADHKNKNSMHNKVTVEVTTFKLNDNANPLLFQALDADVQASFTSKQPGFISRQSGMDHEGNCVVIVFWESLQDADASMSKFMTDESVASYAQMINESSMSMNRFSIDEGFNAQSSSFVEVMSFHTSADIDKQKFDELNKQVELQFTGKREGFVQRITGSNSQTEEIVLIYWADEALSNASLQPFMDAPIAQKFLSKIDQQSMRMGRYQLFPMEKSNKSKVVELLNSFNTGDQAPVAYINPQEYIQHNLEVKDGLEGFGEVMQHAPPEGFKANVIRAFEDGDYVFTHTEYDFFGPKVGFDVFRFENGLIVEHWDNLLPIQAPNPSGRTQMGGATEIFDLEKTTANKEIVRSLIKEVFISGKFDQVSEYISSETYLQHNPAVADGLSGLNEAMAAMATNGMFMKYSTVHKVLAEGNFVLTMSEGTFGEQPTAFYDLFRLQDGLIVEHWDVIAPIPPQEEWKNVNGKF